MSPTPAGILNWQYTSTLGDTDSSVAIFKTGFECYSPVDRVLVSSYCNSGLLAITFSGTKLFPTLFVKDGGLNSSTAAVRDGATLLGSDVGVIRVIDRTGAVKWTYAALTTSINGMPAIAGGRGYIGLRVMVTLAFPAGAGAPRC